MTELPHDSGAQRQRILDAAEERFRRYGYGKTTMAEIAADVAMSAANLYRYFENKQDIAAACAQHCLGERTQRLRAIAHDSHVNATAKLRRIYRENLEITVENIEDQPKINELCEIVGRERATVIRDHREEIVSLIAEVLSVGNASGEFAVNDVVQSAKAVFSTMTLFHVPFLVSMFETEELRHSVDQVAELVITGIKKR